jgi:16S rRNA (cytosine1402-N4)-methyltransferase
MDTERGFSFRNPEADLDMRLDFKSQSLRASDLLNALRGDQLKELFGYKLSKQIQEFRKTKRFEKVKDFLSLFPEKKFGDKTHPATKAMMTLRIAVNTELDNLRDALPQAMELLKVGGRLVVVSFNSSEDMIVKKIFGSKSFIKPSEEEILRNPKSRSAILRVYEK